MPLTTSVHGVDPEPLRTSLRLIDTDGDDRVGPAEWRSFQESLGNRDAADASFQNMDTDHKGYLTIDELVDAVHDYLTSPAQTPAAVGCLATSSDSRRWKEVHVFIRDYERRWLDDPIPALAGVHLAKRLTHLALRPALPTVDHDPPCGPGLDRGQQLRQSV